MGSSWKVGALMFLHGIFQGSASEHWMVPRTPAEAEMAAAMATLLETCTWNLLHKNSCEWRRRKLRDCNTSGKHRRSMQEILTKAAIHFSIPWIQETCTYHECGCMRECESVGFLCAKRVLGSKKIWWAGKRRLDCVKWYLGQAAKCLAIC